ncbi:MAG: hypothetical protein R3Y28_04670 [Candidatus Gastranaerophilales bacterium]
MINKISTPSSNVCENVNYILRGAKKRRSMALASVQTINTDAGIKNKLQAVK